MPAAKGTAGERGEAPTEHRVHLTVCCGTRAGDFEHEKGVERLAPHPPGIITVYAYRYAPVVVGDVPDHRVMNEPRVTDRLCSCPPLHEGLGIPEDMVENHCGEVVDRTEQFMWQQRCMVPFILVSIVDQWDFELIQLTQAL